MREWQVPGYDGLELLGYGTTGEVWRAGAPGGAVALRRLGAVEAGVLAEVRRWATVVRSLPTRHVVRVRSVLRVQGEDVLVVDHAGGGSLAALLASRGTVEPGEVVTVLAPLAEALAVAHAHGLVHRRLGASSVLLTADGMPLLDGLGLEALRDPADGPDLARGAAADVGALGALGRRMLTGSDAGELPDAVPVALAAALQDATDPDPRARPGAEELAARLLAACPALPLRGLPEQPPAPAAPRRRVLPRRVLVAAAVAAVVAAVLGLVGAVGWTWGSRAAQATAGVPVALASGSTPGPLAAPDWRRVLTGLDAARGRAFATGSAARLADVYSTGSALRTQDEAALADLRRRGVTARGLGHALHSVTARTVTDGRVLLVVGQSLRAYQLVDRAGRVQERHTAGPVVAAEVVLVREPGGWRMDSLIPTPSIWSEGVMSPAPGARNPA